MLKTPLGRLRLIGLSEGTSFLLLLGLAMPLKYFADLPEAVMVFGWIHGVLFILYLLATAHVTIVNRWSFFRVIGAVIASVVPTGPFVFDMWLRKEQNLPNQLKEPSRFAGR